MAILPRIKKKGAEGFKSLVASIEQSTPAKKAEIFQMAVLEDPIYMSWILKNVVSVDFFFQMNSADLEIVIDKTPNYGTMLVRAFWNHKDRERFEREILPKKFYSAWKDELSFTTDVKPKEMFAAQTIILKTMRNLQDSKLIDGPHWQIPEEPVLSQFDIGPKDGPFKVTFETGITAAEGLMEKGRRVGSWKHYFDSGKIMAEGSYELGAKWGDWKFYYPNGSVKSQGQFYEDSKHGEWKEWDRNGVETCSEYMQGTKLEPENEG